jgi:hypothetical protein
VASSVRLVTLVTDKDSLFRHLNDLQSASDVNLGFRIVCLEVRDDPEFDRTRSILAGFGVELPESPLDGPSQGRNENRIQAWLGAGIA